MEDKKRFKDIDISSDTENTNIETNNPVSESTKVEAIITGQLHKNVVLFIGPRTVGKTVALIRLTHFLEKNRKTDIKPNTTFRTDAKYKASINSFLGDLHQSNFNPLRTGSIDFLVLDVFKNSDIYCQFLEAPGEAYFDASNPHDDSFPPYITDIMNSDVNKVFVFFFEEGMLIDNDPIAYSKKMASLVREMNRKKDDIIIVFNKSDKMKSLYRNNKPNLKAFKDHLYANKNYNSFLGAINDVGIPVKFVAFSSGTFTDIPQTKKQRWIHSNDSFPDTLWRTIDKCFDSGWLPW